MELLEAACRAARVSPQRVAFVEAAAADSKLGDSVEACALHEVYGADVWVDACKAQLGHMEAASGVVSLIRAVLCLQQRRLPANPLLAAARAPR